MEVKAIGERVYVAEAKGGLSIWRTKRQGELELLGRYRPRGRIVRDVVVPGPGRYAALLLDMSLLDVVDVSDPAAPSRVHPDRGPAFFFPLGDAPTAASAGLVKRAELLTIPVATSLTGKATIPTTTHCALG